MRFAAIFGLIAFASAQAPACAASVDREQAIQTMQGKCYATQASSAANGNAEKCECIARTFVNSLTPAELTNPTPSATTNYKMARARQNCGL